MGLTPNMEKNKKNESTWLTLKFSGLSENWMKTQQFIYLLFFSKAEINNSRKLVNSPILKLYT